LQSLVASECESVQPSLVVAVERLSVQQLTLLSSELSTEGLTGLCA
jgi:hypothetical protein